MKNLKPNIKTILPFNNLRMMLPLLLCILLISSSPAEADNNGNFSPASKFSQKQAENLIRNLNLFPKVDANIVEDDPAADDSPRIVEKRFRFPHIDANSITVADLGHHSGYYRLPHTKGARYMQGMNFFIFHMIIHYILRLRPSNNQDSSTHAYIRKRTMIPAECSTISLNQETRMHRPPL